MEQTSTHPRRAILQSLRNKPHAKIIIIGGGIHGAALARIAGLNGVDCLLLEKQDYASGTSSRSSKMAHGGLRYLENFDFQQVFEGIKAREELFNSARHACKPARFLIPVKKNDWWFRLKLGIGLFLYDLMVKGSEHRHTWIGRKKMSYQGFDQKRTDLMGCFSYCDGVFNDARLVVESVVDAARRGSRCVNYVGVTKVQKIEHSKIFSVTAKDELTGDQFLLTADLVINCAGPWVPCIGHLPSQPLAKQLRYSAGTHLIFDVPWNGPCLFLPLDQPSRYYFVWPHPGGTMVGTTEREVTDIPFEQYPADSEVSEIMARIKKDLPGLGLDEQSLFYAFAGVRTLPLRGEDTEGTATLSRKHIWKNQDGVLTLLGGKWTTSAWTSFEGFKKALSILGLPHEHAKSLDGVKYPGWGTDAELVQLTSDLVKTGLLEKTAHRIVSRLGTRAKYLLEKPGRLDKISDALTVGELELGILEEQAVRIEDLLRRRTEIEYLPGGGLAEVDGVKNYLKSFYQEADLEQDALQYKTRLTKIQTLLKRV